MSTYNAGGGRGGGYPVTTQQEEEGVNAGLGETPDNARTHMPADDAIHPLMQGVIPAMANIHPDFLDAGFWNEHGLCYLWHMAVMGPDPALAEFAAYWYLVGTGLMVPVSLLNLSSRAISSF